ncbi:MAG TPA: hypothetical protein VIX89_18780 [Bryobacteraceae bacterium]
MAAKGAKFLISNAGLRATAMVASFPLLGAALVLIYAWTGWRDSISAAHFLAFCGLGVLCFLPLFRAFLAAEVDILEPVFWISGLYFLYFGVDSIQYAGHAQVVKSMVLAACGVAAFQVGYYVVTRRASSYRVFERNGAPGIGKAWIVYLIGLAATVVSIATGNFFGQYKNTNTFLAAYLGGFTALRFIGFILVPSSAVDRKSLRRAALLAMLLLIPEILIVVLTTSKQLMVYPLLGLIMMRHYLAKRVRLISFAALALILTPVFSLLYAIRSVWYFYVPSQSVSFSDLGLFLREIPSQVLALDATAWSSFAENSLRRFHGTFSLLKILDAGGEVPSGYGAYHGISYLLSILMPRFIQPDKPDANYQVFFGHNFAGVSSNLDVMIPPTHMGVFYLDYGIAGIVVGQLLFGMAAAGVYVLFRKFFQSGCKWALALYAYVFVEMLKIETNPFELLSAGVKMLPLLSLVFWFMRSRRSSGVFTWRRPAPVFFP